LGGVKPGLRNVAYHVPIDVLVAKPAIKPTASVIARDKNNFMRIL
jgi:hypothetical protein